MRIKTLLETISRLRWIWLAGLLVAGWVLVVRSQEPDQALSAETEALIQALLEQGVSPACIQGVDPDAIPLLCEPAATDPVPWQPEIRTALPAGTRGWETIPGVIRNDGLEGFRLEVDTNGAVLGVTLETIATALIAPGTLPLSLQDDGADADRVAGDSVYTAGPFRYNTAVPMPDFFRLDPTSPAGLYIEEVGRIQITELDGSANEFLLDPAVGILRADIPTTNHITVAPDIAITPHLINIRSDTYETQRCLRLLGGSLSHLTEPIYQTLPDVFSFFIFFSTHKIERLPRTASRNFIAGIHTSAQVDYSGTGRTPFDNSAAYGSAGKLLGLNVLDAYDRGTYASNATHELIHQWSSFTSQSLGLTDASGAHYRSRSSVGSLVGGYLWIDNGDGTYAVNCDEGRGGAHRAPALDRYMMGLIDGSQVAAMRVYSETATPPLTKCSGGEPILSEEIVDTVTMETIQSVHGTRSPGPAEAQRDFAIAFVAESHDRLLNSTELTFYEILARHYSQPVPLSDPDPYVGFNWVPITRFFGQESSWRTDLPDRLTVTPPSLAVTMMTGETATGALSFSNTGPSELTFEMTESISAVAWLSADRVSDTISYDDAQPVEITLDATDRLGGVYITTVEIVVSGPSPNVVTVPVTMTVTGTPVLTITKHGPTQVLAGEPITYTLTVTNSGTTAATNVIITDAIPTQASYVSGGTLVGSLVSWTVVSLAGDGGVVQVSFVVTATETVANRDYQARTEGGYSVTGSQPFVTVVTAQPGEPELSIGKTGPARVTVGELITFSLTVTNSGALTATNLVITDVIPAGASYVSGGTRLGDVVRWTLVHLAGNDGIVEASYGVTATTTITNHDYQVSAEGGYWAAGNLPVVTVVVERTGPGSQTLFLPLILK
jgi:uncharacterized repeat protein (TIGR01451 family)